MQSVQKTNRVMRITVGIAISAMCAVAVPLNAFAEVGSSGMAFLKLGASARGVAMGDAMAGATRGPDATYYNPAGLGNGLSADKGTEFLFMHKEWIQDSRTEFLGTRFSVGEHNALGVSVLTTTVSDIEIRTQPGEAQGTFTSRDLGIGLTYCYEIEAGLRAGLTARFLYEQILIDDAHGMSVDIGAQYEGIVDGLNVGAVIANIGKTSEFRNEPIKLPALLRAGAAYKRDIPDLNAMAILAADIEDIFAESQARVRIGGECAFKGVFFVRGGYQFGSEGRGLSIGGGVQYGILGVDYGFSRLSNDLGNGHTIALHAEF
jgi:hypothetical protein